MASQAQIDANRLNAQKSTGPATEDGKAKSRFNAFKHGAYAIEAEVTGEDPEKFAAREKEYFEHFKPKGPEETYHIQAMIDAANEQDRCRILDSYALKHLIDQVAADAENPIGEAICLDAAGANSLEKLHRRREAAHRRWLRSSKTFNQIKLQRLEAEAYMAQRATAAAQAQPDAVGQKSVPAAPPATYPHPQNTPRPATPLAAVPVPASKDTR